jgi:hypothetical protein
VGRGRGRCDHDAAAQLLDELNAVQSTMAVMHPGITVLARVGGFRSVVRGAPSPYRPGSVCRSRTGRNWRRPECSTLPTCEALEDLIEFMVTEEMVEPRDQWRTTVDEHRARWNSIQLRAAVRRQPNEAAEALRVAGWKVQEPA